ncbi:pentatricopeptide repeat-containing protein At3g26782, mitochondrial-like [Curcuma longa]|uniref:pentatricopeptide repeat-containing protein At3g26782, mitochondrial-like n=1 Tax=Curcuma longa TaxID=136217 RepID=UPI003D9E3E9C
MSLRRRIAVGRAFHHCHFIPEAPPEPRALAAAIRSSASLRSLKPLHAAALRHHPSDLLLSSALAFRYSLLGSRREALHLLSDAAADAHLLISGDTFLWNSLIRGLADAGANDRVLALYRRMREFASPDKFTFPPLLKACALLGNLEEGVKVHGDAADLGFDSDIFVRNSLIAMYGKGGRLDTARQLFDEMPERNVVTWTAMIGALVQNGHSKEALALFHRMLEERVRPNRATFLTVIPCVFRFDDATALHKSIIRHRLESEVSVQNAIVGMYARCGDITRARKMFDEISNKDLASWSSMIEAYAREDMLEEALKLLGKMGLLGIVPDRVTLLGVLRACSNSTLASLRHAQLVHGYAIRSSLVEDVMVETAVIDSYVKRGSVSTASRIFERMQGRNLVTWSTMISGYGMHGKGKEALELFNHMKGLLKPDHISFVSVLSACSHAGLVCEGWQCFNSMTTEFGLVPRAEHYACMVDLLGRAGKLEEARHFIEQMPIKPDCSVWGSLLGACRIHPDAQIAELAANSLFELNPENSGRYVLLSNIYTSLGKIEEAHRIRIMMRKKGVKKTSGYSVVEWNNKLYKFLVGDCSNPQSDLIYRELEKLMDRIKAVGYVPNTNFSLHDVEEETKEESLYVHSEKLAIVFGLINLRPGSTIRIHKNLRVCGDCHTATKYISEVTKREIVMRDSHRFHHFREGLCSCGDYW